MMNPEIKAAFVEALESGEYPQTSGRLRKLDLEGNTAGFCCIGVLSELAVKAGVAEWRESKIQDTVVSIGIVPAGSTDDTMLETHNLPNCVAVWAGLPIDGDINFGPDKAYDTLIALNDQRGYDFEQIAEVVKEKL